MDKSVSLVSPVKPESLSDKLQRINLKTPKNAQQCMEVEQHNLNLKYYEAFKMLCASDVHFTKWNVRDLMYDTELDCAEQNLWFRQHGDNDL